MNILFTVCGRKGSKGIKNKNIREFLGYPLPYYTLSAIDLFKGIHEELKTDIVVNTDSEELISIMQQNPFFEIDTIVREAALSGDMVAKTAVIYDCLDKMQRQKKVEYDVVVDLDITSPIRTVPDIECMIDTHVKTGADVTTSVTDSRRNPYFNMVKRTEKGFKRVVESNFTTRQQAPEIFDMNASMYAYTPDFLKTGKGVLDGYCECIHMFDTGILDLDHENDFELMQVIAEYIFRQKPEFGLIQDNIKKKMDLMQMGYGKR
ncbi:acylneuraminate cytidylyltransferase family protein [Lachnospiraceae bacterium 62-35]